ncbi:CerR family C-terminal domain-containing protein [Sporolituus thermophilus]|uniref:Transcriptional regulator, TetR family n=1 Tax=Sporolituus thermophilus DSM 23256 TaxID=1123285 RepID=A0A1G7NI00_9FIRM|nr:CerR family C-terminal domain-containing protein [Sporolituus thermophilus]SDF73547.1 transcriptional regulator, TetR family [Sporolituus thermophilus DSM 23256]
MEKATPAKLIEVATALFAEKGFAAVSIREVAKAAGVNSALIAYYFGNKEGLYRELLETHFSRMADGIAAIAAENLPPHERIIRFANFLLQLHHENPRLIRLATREITNPSSCFETIVKKYIERNYRFLLEAIQEGVATGDFRPDINPGYAALSLAGIINFYFLAQPLVSQLLPPYTAHDREYGRQAIEVYLNGIRRKRHE